VARFNGSSPLVEMSADGPVGVDLGGTHTRVAETLTGGRALEQRLGMPLAEVEDERFWESYAQSLAHGLANFALVAGVEAIALGGSIIQRRLEIWPSLRASLAAQLTYHRLSVLPAHLREDAPLVGAAMLLATPEHSILH
jgi:predicted NBD/HSP70 family sugar kinase